MDIEHYEGAIEALLFAMGKSVSLSAIAKAIGHDTETTRKIIDNMMLWSNTTEEELMKKKEIKTDFGQTLYWDYYLYVKEKPITNWNKKTYILYGNKDNMQNEETIKSFSDKFNCELTILEDGEHYFHTEEQLKYYKEWLKNL